ncbi:hypothetical protein P4I00_24440, partial [Escherichia coli]|uniref:hypothetical protein n=1 Tax=Escherichia coli TaxID=562 RepID=UPI003CF2C398
DRNRSHWSTSKTPSYTKSVSWQHHQTLDIITTTLTPLMLQRLKHNINAWVNEELSPPCLWDSRYACQQKMRIFNLLSPKLR